MAFGQTGSGKTYTMEGYQYEIDKVSKMPVPVLSTPAEDLGIVPRAIAHLFGFIEKLRDQSFSVFRVKLSFYQIYNELIDDLLVTPIYDGNHQKIRKGLKLKSNEETGDFSIDGLKALEAATPDEAMRHYNKGIVNKTMGYHKLNATSSRSHSIFTLYVECINPQSEKESFTSRLNLVDLAGSEKGLMGTSKNAQKEAISINKSLLTLKKCINALSEAAKTEENPTMPFVPYRESKLTSLLKQSLSGGAFCLFIACLSPIDSQIDESFNVLSYASKAMKITTKPMKALDKNSRDFVRMKNRMEKMVRELMNANEHIKKLSSLLDCPLEQFGTDLINNPLNEEDEINPEDPMQKIFAKRKDNGPRNSQIGSSESFSNLGESSSFGETNPLSQKTQGLEARIKKELLMIDQMNIDALKKRLREVTKLTLHFIEVAKHTREQFESSLTRTMKSEEELAEARAEVEKFKEKFEWYRILDPSLTTTEGLEKLKGDGEAQGRLFDMNKEALINEYVKMKESLEVYQTYDSPSRFGTMNRYRNNIEIPNEHRDSPQKRSASLNKKPNQNEESGTPVSSSRKQEFLPEISSKKPHPLMNVVGFNSSVIYPQIEAASNDHFIQTINRGRYPKPMSTLRTMKGISPYPDPREKEQRAQTSISDKKESQEAKASVENHEGEKS